MGPSPATSSTDLHKCSFPGCPLPVSIAISLVESFQEMISKTAGDHQGILYGGLTPGETIVLAGQEVAAFDSKEICIAMSRAHDPVVGCYRIREGNSLALTSDELALTSTLFANAGSVVLLIERRPGRAVANFFFLSEGTFLNIPLLEFPVDAARLRRRTYQRKNLEEVPQNPPAPKDPMAQRDGMPRSLPQDSLWRNAEAEFGLGEVGLPQPGLKVSTPSTAKSDVRESAAPQEPSEGQKQGRGRRNFLSIFSIVVCLALFALSAVLYVNRLPKPAANDAPSHGAQTGAATALHAERQGEDLKISWDLNSAGVAGATDGVLDIDDGGARQQIQMTADQVRFGSVLYTPVSAHVSVRLSTLRDNRNIGQGAVLVLLNKPPQTAVAPGQQKTRIPFEVKAERQIPVATQAPAQTQSSAALERTTPVRDFVPPPAEKTLSEIQPPEGAAPPALNPNPAPQLALTGLAAAPLQLPQPGAPRTAPSKKSEEPRKPNVPPAAAVSPVPGPVQTNLADYVSPVLTFQAGVRMPPELPRTFKPIAITVRVDLDPAGRVMHVEPVSASGIHRLLLQAAVDAAWKCRFEPAKSGQRPVSSRVTLVFHVAPGSN